MTTITATSPGGGSRTEILTADQLSAKLQEYENHGWTVEIAEQQDAMAMRDTLTLTTVTMPATIAEWDAEEWLCGTVLQSCGITAASTPNDISEAEEWIDTDALDQNVRLTGTRQWLETRHDELVSWANGVGRL